jgi:radical SAM superfamily enzyme YgiQ (UPF0313 family)
LRNTTKVLRAGGEKAIRLEPGTKRVVVLLLKPSHYDDDGFPHRYLRAVLPSNSLAVMKTTTEEALASFLPTAIESEVLMLEDGIQRHAKEIRRLERRFPEEGTALIVGLVAVQSAQFPRACDLIDRWQAHGAKCAIGGFHVSGSISTMLDGISDRQRSDVPCPHVMPAEIQALMDRGVVVFHGEAEGAWAETLRDMLEGTAKPLYRGGQPDIREAPLPTFEPSYFERSFATVVRTVDTNRGCPFVCSFCTIINVQGRVSRERDPSAIVEQVREICDREGKVRFFFTDDNFARNPRWEEILDGLIALRSRGYDINFMIEADLACGKIRGFLDKLSAAGCGQIFMGVESVNPANLAEAHKRQNRVAEYAELWGRCHELGMIVHAGYIIGFSHDTPESVERDVATLHELGVDHASFFILTPLPGSEDHARMVAAGVRIDPDFSKCDSFHAIVDHPTMTRDEWMRAYERAWRVFYSLENMVTVVRRMRSRRTRLSLLRGYLWYRWSVITERTHPMIAGFYRFRPYRERRPGAPRLSRWTYALQEIRRHARYFARVVSEYYRFQYLVFDSQCKPALVKRHEEWRSQLYGIGDWFRLTFGRRISRRWLHAFWLDYARNRWRLLWNPLAYRWHLLLLPIAISEVVYAVRFAAFLPQLVRDDVDR